MVTMDCGATVMLLCIEGKAELVNVDGNGRGDEKVGCEVVDILSVSSIVDDDDGDTAGETTVAPSSTIAAACCFSPANTVVGATVNIDVIFVVGVDVVGGDIVGTKVTSCCGVVGSLVNEEGDSDAASVDVVGMTVGDNDDGGEEDGSDTSSSSPSS